MLPLAARRSLVSVMGVDKSYPSVSAFGFGLPSMPLFLPGFASAAFTFASICACVAASLAAACAYCYVPYVLQVLLSYFLNVDFINASADSDVRSFFAAAKAS